MKLAEDNHLREEIIKRMKELDYKQAFICKDAEERGMKIAPDRLSKYLKGKRAGLTEDQVLWLSTRLGIYVSIGYGKPYVEEGKVVYKVTKFDETEAIIMLSKIFSKNG